MISQSDINQIIVENKIDLQSLTNKLIGDYFISSKYLTINDSNDKTKNNFQIFSINTLYIELFEFIEKNNYKIIGAPRACYIDGCWNQEDPEKWLSIIQVPVEKI